ncbi:Ig-like domain-containing protein [Bifidobacterium platyrrhinorum]|uniref:Tandem-95 repeat protein n=1 Tax=Bifidobacterium platyrrhinorum TaxID=2661628 RepID=A0A6L9SVF6_9BIFI|nr:tandem-95 repeat protein [Bifidobacterium platyrrhinorum]NEG55843.1 tandem-95 repeat protein [Bifidobacterium platyrrhinorum]
MAKSSQAYERSRRAGALLRRLVPSGNRRWVTPVVTLLLILAAIAGAVIISSVTQRHVQLDDGTVWVTSLKNRKAARFNVRLREADAAVASSAQRFDVSQHGSDTVLDETSRASSIKASTIGVDGSTEVKGNTVSMIGGGTVAFLNTKTGDVWAGSADDVTSVSPASAKPQMRLGTGGRAVVDSNGVVWGYRPSDGMIMELTSPQSRVAQLESITSGGQTNADSFTVVDGAPVITSGPRLIFKGGDVALGETGRFTLQSPSVDGEQSGWVAAAGQDGLRLVDLTKRGAKPVVLSSGGKGEPARPVSSGGCVHAAWSRKADNYVRVCSAKDGGARFASLQAVNATSELVFRTNHRQVVLNDVVNGNVWNPQDSTDVIKIQWNTIQTEQSEKQQQSDDTANNQRKYDKTCSQQSGEIKAENDDFGARAGGEQILDVLRNDQQTDCSVLRITHVNAPSGADVTVSPVYDGRYVQLDATKAHAGSASFSYEISDGRGQTSTATVDLTLQAGDDHAPAQSDVPPELAVEQGATYTTNALGSFTDPDGDPMTLVSAVPQNSDQVSVSTRADGQLTFNTGSMTSGRVGVQVTASDGEQTGTGMIYFSVKPANTLAADIDPVVKSALPDTDTTIDLKPYVHATSAQPAQLSAVDAPDGASVTMNAADQTLQFKAQNPGTYYVPYTITQGSVPATGLARVEVQPATGEAAKPVAANDVALLGAGNTAIVEPLANDVDPMGGVLSVTSVSADASSGIKTGLVSHKRVYLTARQVPTRPVEVTYTVANAAGTSTGTIVLQPPALSTGNSAPKAQNVNAQVRTGGIVSVDVLDHVSYPDGTTVKLQNNLQTDKATFRGIAFVSGDTVRYQASNEPGVYPVTYTVKDDLGNSASGTITITVHKGDAEHKSSPTPHDTEAQVAAGQKVRIPITLTGIDTDGDDDQLLGLGNKAPQLGRITEVGANYLVYEAYSDSSGTDTFSYAVEDWTGRRAQAQIRVGVFTGASDSGVYARDDEVTLRPGTAATVPVTLNDISGDNTDLTVEPKLEPQGIQGARVKDNAIDFTTPDNAGTAYIVYTVRDKAGLSDTGTLTVNVDPNAPIDPPQAYDYRVPPAATIDKKSVDVDVSQWIANPSGTAADLKVGVHPSARDHARVKGGDKSTVITVDLTDEARSVPYTVTNTRYGITSTAFIQVPAYGVFPPTLRPNAPEIKVNARETVQINIADYVRVGAGKEATVDGADSVSATKAADNDLYVNDKTLKFTAPKDYSGPASITFTAVDGKKGSDKTKIINSAVITLPITVVGRNTQPPTFSSSNIDVVAGEPEKTIDLKALTHAPDGASEDERQYTYSGGSTSGKVEASVTNAGQLQVRADKDAAPGTTVSVPVRIKYAAGTVEAGMTVRVVSSTRPLARLTDKTVQVRAGGTQTVAMLADAYNPFPDEPLTIVRCAADDATRLTVDCAESGDISITAPADLGASTNRVLVTVQDGTKAEERKVTGTITVAVIDRPEAPMLSPADAKPQDGSIDLTWTPGASNGSPITDYEVSWSSDGGDATTKSCGAVTTCKITGLKNGKAYSFKVRARNEVGWSPDSNTVTGTPDRVPPAPSSVSVDDGFESVSVSWDMPDYDGSAPDYYTVTLSNGAKDTVKGSRSKTFTIPSKDITDGMTVTATVSAHNKVGDGTGTTSKNTAKPYGTPDPPSVTASQAGANSTTVKVSAALGAMHNTTCDRVELQLGGDSRTVSCSSTSADFTLSDGDLGSPLTPKATVRTTQGRSATGTGPTITPSYKPGMPRNLSVSASGGECRVTWQDGDGKSGSFGYAVDGGPQSTTYDTSFSYDPGKWRSCGTVHVWKIFKNATSDQASATSDAMPNKPKAQISNIDFKWDDRNTLHLLSGSVDTYGQQATVVLTLTDGNGHSEEHTWTAGSGPEKIDMKDSQLEGDVTWRITLRDGASELIDGVEASDKVSNSRPMASGNSTSLSGMLPDDAHDTQPWVRGLAYRTSARP